MLIWNDLTFGVGFSSIYPWNIMTGTTYRYILYCYCMTHPLFILRDSHCFVFTPIDCSIRFCHVWFAGRALAIKLSRSIQNQNAANYETLPVSISAPIHWPRVDRCQGEQWKNTFWEVHKVCARTLTSPSSCDASDTLARVGGVLGEIKLESISQVAAIHAAWNCWNLVDIRLWRQGVDLRPLFS